MTVLPRDAELDTIKWINGYRADGAPIFAIMLKRNDKEIAQEVGVSLSVFQRIGRGAKRSGVVTLSRSVHERAKAKDPC